ncbi:MAG TPA: cell division protein FtsQ/DivIB, partial [Bacteroidota bacterium]|nr:cell division protein FtsQ/DivIB [Bacteroidota bacterium]
DTISLGAIRKRLISHPYIRDARVNRTYPDALTISIDERVPVASFTLRGAIRYIDEEGVVLPYLQSEMPYDLPGITGIPELNRTRIGEAIGGDEYFEALGILIAALETDSAVYRLISEVDMNDGGDVFLYSSEDAVRIIFGRGDARRKFTLLRTFWEKYAREGGPENLEYLDLRFNDQVVAKWNNKPQKSVNLSSMQEGEGKH